VAAALLKARGEVKALIMGEIAGVLHKDVSDTSRAFVMKLSPEEARAKVLKYMEEDFNRARAEGLRLAEVLERNEAVWASKVRARACVCVCVCVCLLYGRVAAGERSTLVSSSFSV